MQSIIVPSIVVSIIITFHWCWFRMHSPNKTICAQLSGAQFLSIPRQESHFNLYSLTIYNQLLHSCDLSFNQLLIAASQRPQKGRCFGLKPWTITVMRRVESQTWQLVITEAALKCYQLSPLTDTIRLAEEALTQMEGTKVQKMNTTKYLIQWKQHQAAFLIDVLN